MDDLARVFKAAGHPIRLRILEQLGRGGEACVCHLENALGLRQAYISQQLMRLRQAGLVTDRREGLNIFYSLSAPGVLRLVTVARRLAAPPTQRATQAARRRSPQPACPCPRCRRLGKRPTARRAPRMGSATEEPRSG